MPRIKAKARTKRAPSVLLALVLAFLGAAAAGLRQEGPLRPLLPPGNGVPGWALDGDPQEFEGEDLYTYIDGGAEIYQEYGFRRVIVQDYKRADGKSVSLEIFEMETPAAAFGMFTFKRSGTGKTAAIGSGAELDAYYLNFWKGRLLVTLTGFDESADTVRGLTEIGRLVDAKIHDPGTAPALVAALPVDGVRQGSVKYFKGLLGLNNLYSFHTARGLDFSEGVRGAYENGAVLIVLDYGSPEARGRAALDLKAYLAGSERFARAAGPDTAAFMVRDGNGQYVCLAESGSRILAGMGADPSAAAEVVARGR